METNTPFPFDTFSCSNGSLSVFLSSSGSGFTSHTSLALTRWYPDPTRDADGYYFYLQDLQTEAFWSLGFQPVRSTPDQYEVVQDGGKIRFTRIENGIRSVMKVWVLKEADVEIRQIKLENCTKESRILRLTSYAEIVLNSRMGDVGHPAFSKLFVQTAWDAARGALMANRRLRSPGDTPGFMAHWLMEARPDAWETDRMRFIGRGRTLQHPQALDQALSGTTGNVLDAAFSLQKEIRLEAGESITLHFALAFAKTEDQLHNWMAQPLSPHVGIQPARFAAEEQEMLAVFLAKTSKNNPINTRVVCRPSPLAVEAKETSLLDFNGLGGFSEDGKAYVLYTHAHKKTPLPWTNVVSNDEHGFMISESGSAYTWSANSRENRLTPWANDPVMDPFGEAFYLKNRKTGEVICPLPGPRPSNVAFRVVHGFGYSTFSAVQLGIAHEVTFFVPPADPLKIAKICLRNQTQTAQTFSFYAYHELVMGPYRHMALPHLQTGRAENGALWAENPHNGEFSARRSFLQIVGAPVSSVTTDRTAFLGRYGAPDAPEGIWADHLNQKVELEAHTDPCLAVETQIELPPETEVTFYVLLGQGENASRTQELMMRYADPAACETAQNEGIAFWQKLTDKIQVTTPDAALDRMANGWLVYQNLSCRIMGRSAFYQSGGAYGYRDQLQDTGGMFYHLPDLTRSQILLHAAHQFEEGDVLHWWHPPLSKGIRTRFSDDLLWLPYITSFYINSTGDWALLDEEVGFKSAALLKKDEDEIFVFAEDTNKSASLYEHACMAIDRSLTKGDHELPLMGTGDWNDGMNRVGREGKGESVWLGFFLYQILSDWISICEKRRDVVRLTRYAAYQKELYEALNTSGWDGSWYRRAYYDNGVPLGASGNDECRIDTIAQAWAVISKVAPPDRARVALEAMLTHLVSENEGIIRLLTPAFDRTPHDPGYIKGYLPGVRENGGQYTHAALWAVKALAETGKGTLAARLLGMISPVSHTRTPEEVARYQTEPYVIAADVYGVAPHVGRGGWTWYTGSAGWMFRVLFESVLGFGVQENQWFTLKPCIPLHWPGFTIQYRCHDNQTRYLIEVENPESVEVGISAASIDGMTCVIEEDVLAKIPIITDGKTHRVVIRMGKPPSSPPNMRNGRPLSAEATKENTEQVYTTQLFK
ncbi:MAG: hypothetical protein JNN12_01260 [Bacteroidetes Order II. Incertae sedis bacterium]|nr:hypothetical protein [Bacteroidetes Order II. bacterium]